MKFIPTHLTVNHTKDPYATVDSNEIAFGWSAQHQPGRKQSAYSIRIRFMDSILWESGFVSSAIPFARHHVADLPSGASLTWDLQLKDDLGEVSQVATGSFRTACLENWEGQWICDPQETEADHNGLYFFKDFDLEQLPVRAALFHCGLGWDQAFVNGISTNANRLQPAYTN